MAPSSDQVRQLEAETYRSYDRDKLKDEIEQIPKSALRVRVSMRTTLGICDAIGDHKEQVIRVECGQPDGHESGDNESRRKASRPITHEKEHAIRRDIESGQQREWEEIAALGILKKHWHPEQHHYRHAHR